MRVRTLQNIDISLNLNGHISVVREATVIWLGMLVVLHVLCMLIWPWPDPRSRSWGFIVSENCDSDYRYTARSCACWWRWPSAPLPFLLLGEASSPSIGNTLWRVSTMFTRSAITSPEVNGFGWNLGNSKYIVWSWPWQILGTIHAEARAGDLAEVLFFVS